jgi:hypothetical protein
MIFRRSIDKYKKERQSQSSRRESGKQSNVDCFEIVLEEFRENDNEGENNGANSSEVLRLAGTS